MSANLILDKNYTDWISRLSNRYRAAQIKAAISVNSEMLNFYWELGRDIAVMQNENKYGSKFFEALSRDLKAAIPGAKGLSVKNLYYIRNFYLVYSKIFPELKGIFPQVMGNSISAAAYIPKLAWGHHRILLDRFSKSPSSIPFYLTKSVEEGWSQNMLLNMLDGNLHLRQGQAVTNFKECLPELTSDLAQEITKDPYIFDFTNLEAPYKERELKEELLKNITKFLLELGEGFAFLGQEYKLNIGQTEQFTDLLFYHLKLRCYVVIELKTTKFEPGYLGQLGMYVTAVNHLLKTEQDNPTIGLLICKTKDNVLAQYSLEGYNLPIGVSQYQLDKFMPENFVSALPSIEEIEAKLK